MSFLNLRIGGRLFSGFGLLIFLCAALAGSGVWQLTAIREEVKAMNRWSANAVRAGDIQIELQITRRALLRYMSDQDEASLAESEKRLTKIADLLVEADKSVFFEERRIGYREIGKLAAELKT
jgi:hypothetical protein